MTVHGERAVIPSARKAEAAKALERFTTTYNKAYREVDPALISDVETGPLHALEEPRLKAQRANRPDGNPTFPPLELTDARYTIPKQAGWPKFFLADTESNRDRGRNRWLLVFTRIAAAEPWKAAYLSILSKDEVPEFAQDKDGWAKPAGGGSLATDPRRLSQSYTDYLRSGEGRTFEDGPATSGVREQREGERKTRNYWTDFIDQPARPPRYVPVALRTTDGGALAFFAAHHMQKQTMAQGLRISKIKDDTANALLEGKAEKTLTLVRISESAVKVPARNAADASDGRVAFLNRLEGLTAARGG
ncbi:hypothetical protein [Streptomyces sp. 8N706]|uniref:hypothetical protein n=1 Tax=Streptomyces sp. 8N706 TaxID=3457416 RepID=UPI003FD44790